MTGLAEVRAEARRRFEQLGFPTRKNEDWKYTNVAPIARTVFASPNGARALPADPLSALEADRLVFVNGRYRRDLSSVELCPAPAGHLARYAAFNAQSFVALNTASFEDTAYVEIPAGRVLERPVYVLHLSAGQTTASHPRTLIVAGKGAQADLVELYAGTGAGYFTNAVTEIEIGEGAVVNHYKLQTEAPDAYHVATVQAHQERVSVWNSYSISLGGLLVRNDINSVLAGEGCECTLNGLFLTGGEQHVDNHTALDHASPHCSSREYYRGILAGRSTGVFNGKILVRKDAQKTDAIQSNKNLLLSPDASINTKPQLEILADDVRCTHGATVGQLDADALFYMRSRGIGGEDARHLLTVAFASDVLDRVRLEPLRARLEELVRNRLESL